MRSEQGAHGWGDLLRALLIVVAGIACAGQGVAAELRIGGTGNALGTIALLGKAFAAQHPDILVRVLPSVGSSGAIKAVPKGGLDIGLSSRALTPEESKPGLIALEYARSPLVFAVAAKSSATGLTLDEIADIYAGRKAAWPDGSQIRPVLRQAGDDNTSQVKKMSPAIAAALTDAEKLTGLPFATTDQEAADKTEGIPGALGVMALSLMRSENRALRPLALGGVEPTVANIASGRYPYVKHFYLILRAGQSATVQQFVAFVQSPAGHEILTHSGNWVP